MTTTNQNEDRSSTEEGKKAHIDLDTILVEEIGQFGWFQIKTVLLAWIVVIFCSWGANEYVFTTARINTRCYIPECDQNDPNFTPSWILNAVPGSSNTSFEGCVRYTPSTALAPSSEVCPATWFDNTQQQPCERQIYQNTLSVAYDYNLGCEEWRRSLIGTVRTFGTLTALPITGWVSDRWGRRAALTLNAFNTGWIGALRYFANTYAGFVASEFFEATFGSGMFSSAYILLMEVSGPRYRVAAGASLNTFFSVGQITMGLIAMAVPTWRELTLTLYVPQLITILYFWLINESVRWYISKDRYEEAGKVLKRIAKANGKSLSDKSLEALKRTSEEEKKLQELREQEMKDEPWLIVLVFRHKQILIRCIVSPIWWLTTTFIYYGMSINSVNLIGNRYLNYVAVSAAQIPGYWTAVLLLGKVGRKPVLITAFWICTACQVAFIFMPADQYAWALTVYLVGTYCSACVMTCIYVYTAELYPTKYRHSLFAYSSMIGRVGAMLAPLTPALGASVWEPLPFALFGGFAFVSGLLVFITPETLGTKFPDTMEEATNIGKKTAPEAK